MKHQITIKSTPIGASTKVTGFVDNNEVVSLSNGVSDTWRVSGSSCLPSNLVEAAAYLECMQRAFARAKEYGAEVPAGN